MKHHKLLTALALFLFIVSCKKEQAPASPQEDRNIQFFLYTTQDFGVVGDNETIDFTLTVCDQNKTLWDSALAPMKIGDIPDHDHKFIFNKRIPGNNNGQLVVGFLYTIEGVGQSWNLDTARAGETFKTIDYNFN